MLPRPHGRIREIELRPEGDAIGRELVGRHANDRECVRAQLHARRRAGVRLAGRGIAEVAADHGEARGLEALNGFGHVMELRLVVAEIDHGRGALREGSEHREIDRARRPPRDDVAVLERVAVDQHRQRHARMLAFEPIDPSDELGGALIRRMLIAHDDDDRLGRCVSGRHETGEDEDKGQQGETHAQGKTVCGSDRSATAIRPPPE